MLEWLAQPQAWTAIIALTFLEVVLGIDNIIFIAIVTAKLPKERQNQARIIGLILAMLTRIALLFFIAWIITLQTPILELASFSFSGKDLFLIAGGAFLIYKGIIELKELSLKPEAKSIESNPPKASFLFCILQIAILDIVFSLDSVITAVGVLQDIIAHPHAITLLASIAIIFAVFIMIFVSSFISNFINKNPSIKLFALCILVLIGVSLISDGLGYHFSKNYIYFAMGFGLIIEALRLLKSH